MDQHPTPSDLALKMIEYISSGQFAKAQAIFAEDALIKVMFGIPAPYVIRGGDLRMWLERSRIPEVPMYHDLEVCDVVLTPAADPELVTAEWTYKSRLASGTVVENHNAMVLRARDGKVLETHDYHNHVTRELANGRTARIVALIEGMAAQTGV